MEAHRCIAQLCSAQVSRVGWRWFGCPRRLLRGNDAVNTASCRARFAKGQAVLFLALFHLPDRVGQD